MLIVLVGVVLFIIPGIIWGLKYSLSMVAILDKRLSPVEAVRFSGKITSGYIGKLFVLFILFFGVAILLGMAISQFQGRVDLTQEGILRFVFLGLIPSMFYYFAILPFSFLVSVTAYEALSKQYEYTSMR